MCCKIDKKQKAQIAKHFPPGWKFFFDPTVGNKKSNVSPLVKKLDGLILLSPNGSPFYSVERAMNKNPACKLEVVLWRKDAIIEIVLGFAHQFVTRNNSYIRERDIPSLAVKSF